MVSNQVCDDDDDDDDINNHINIFIKDNDLPNRSSGQQHNQ